MVKIGPASRALVAFAAALLCPPVSAGTVSGTMTVSATVEPACNLNVRPLHFQTLRSDAARGEADSSIAVACTPDTEFTVSLDDGQHRADGGRRMASASGELLAYELYSDAARTRRWGATLTDSVSGQIADGGAVTLPIYGRIDATTATAGVYTDVVTVTVSF